jgi:hypothetical protein
MRGVADSKNGRPLHTPVLAFAVGKICNRTPEKGGLIDSLKLQSGVVL